DPLLSGEHQLSFQEGGLLRHRHRRRDGQDLEDQLLGQVLLIDCRQDLAKTLESADDGRRQEVQKQRPPEPLVAAAIAAEEGEQGLVAAPGWDLKVACPRAKAGRVEADRGRHSQTSRGWLAQILDYRWAHG